VLLFFQLEVFHQRTTNKEKRRREDKSSISEKKNQTKTKQYPTKRTKKCRCDEVPHTCCCTVYSLIAAAHLLFSLVTFFPAEERE
jgi:hypothetical protein